MIKFVKISLVLLLIAGSLGRAAAYTTQFTDDTQTSRLRWKNNLIAIALSTSLIKPNPYIKPETDVNGAIQRSLATWEKASDIKFQVVWTDKQAASPAGKSGDGVSLLTIAPTPENLVLFSGDVQEVSARTRIFFNRKGNITEADIVLNPYEQFSTDGSIGTFDLEATLTHEIGHLLGLEHTFVTGATMNAQTGKNGVYNLPGFSARTLAEDDLSGIRSLYGANDSDDNCCGAVGGKLIMPNGRSAKDFQVWTEESATGRMAAGGLTNANGNFQIEGLAAGRYKIYTQSGVDNSTKTFSVEKLGEFEILKGKTQYLSKRLSGIKKKFDLRYVGFNGQITGLAVPINGGKSYVIYVGGHNLNAEELTVGFNSPHLKISPKTLMNHNYGDDISVISFEVKVSADIPLGEYSFFLHTTNEQSQFAVGSLTVETFVNPWNSYVLEANE